MEIKFLTLGTAWEWYDSQRASHGDATLKRVHYEVIRSRDALTPTVPSVLTALCLRYKHYPSFFATILESESTLASTLVKKVYRTHDMPVAGADV